MNQPADDKTSPTRNRQAYKRRIRNVLIHKPMLREFSLVMISLLIVSSLTIDFVIHQIIHEAAFGGGFQFGKVNAYEVLSQVRYELIVWVTLILFATLIILGIFGVFFLHLGAGPVYRFRQVFIRINRGEIPRKIKLREGDFFSETATEINHPLARLQFEDDQKKAVLSKIDQILASGDVEKIPASLRELRSLVEQAPDSSS